MNELEAKKEQDMFFAGAKINLHNFSNLVIEQQDLSFLSLISSIIQCGEFKGVFFVMHHL